MRLSNLKIPNPLITQRCRAPKYLHQNKYTSSKGAEHRTLYTKNKRTPSQGAEHRTIYTQTNIHQTKRCRAPNIKSKKYYYKKSKTYFSSKLTLNLSSICKYSSLKVALV
jgi:hypothetical protein